MFSQLRQAVENFAPPPPPRSSSQEMTRSASPKGSPSHLPKSNSLSDVKGPKSNLEERLRAKLAAAEISRSPTPVTHHPLSPTSTPLPASPAISPVQTSMFDITTPLNLDSFSPPRVQSPQPFSVAGVSSHSLLLPPTKTTEEKDDRVDIPDTLGPSTHSTVTVKAYAKPHSKSIDESAPHEEPTLPEIDPNDVESLQTRLRLVEQRFTGMLLCPCG